MQVSLHILENKVEIACIICFDDPFQFDYVEVVELMQNRNLAVGSLSIYIILKSVKYFLESIVFSWLFMYDSPHMSIGATA